MKKKLLRNYWNVLRTTCFSNVIHVPLLIQFLFIVDELILHFCNVILRWKNIYLFKLLISFWTLNFAFDFQWIFFFFEVSFGGGGGSLFSNILLYKKWLIIFEFTLYLYILGFFFLATIVLCFEIMHNSKFIVGDNLKCIGKKFQKKMYYCIKNIYIYNGNRFL